MKNLILLHLESLNLINYRSNPELFPNLLKMEQSSIVFDRYYSTATSTFMVLADLLYGDMRQYECCASLNDIPLDYYQKETLLDLLKGKGYTTGLWYFPMVPDIKGAEDRHVAGFCNNIEVIASREDFKKRLEDGIKQDSFAYMICNCTSNLALNRELDITDKSWDTDYWANAYRYLDGYCKELFDILESSGLLQDTIIVMYGDHGDDYWSHGMHAGLAHAIEPNNLLIRTPLIIWDGKKRQSPERFSNPVQTTDLKEMIISLLEGDDLSEMTNRKYIVSRNSYAAQPVRAESFNKAYTVCDGRYLLMVSGHGLEMYDTYMDMSCTNNLLRFFEYEEGVMRSRYFKEKYHFATWWNAREQRLVRNKFYELRDVLYKEMLDLYRSAGLGEDQMKQEMQMDRVAGREY